MPKGRLRGALSSGPWRVKRHNTRPSSLARLLCKLLVAACSGFCNCHVPVVLCILHLTTAIGRLLGEFVDGEARAVTPSLRQDLQVLLSERRAGWSVYGSASPDGEETANFFEAWPDIAKCLGIRPSTGKYKAIANM